MTLLALLLLGVVPVVSWRYASARVPRHTWLITGIAFGLVVSPLSVGLYSTYFFGPLGLPSGMLGLVSSLFHGAPGYETALWLGIVPSHEVVSGSGSIYVELLNGVIWALGYGLLGLFIDRHLHAHSKKPA